jgi:flagellar M-ring protein FliF
VTVLQTRPPAVPPQWQRFALVFAAVAAVLLAAYFFLFRQDYGLLFGDLSPSEASLVISELEAMEVAYRIADGGRAVEVPARKADELRVKIASTTSASILLIEGIENARVHIAVPERATFRSAQAAATASVTLVLRPGATLGAERVNAVRHLVAASVPGLSPDAVTILDQNGNMIASTAFAPKPAATDLADSGPPPAETSQKLTSQLLAIVSDILPGSAPEIILNLPAQPAQAAPGEAAVPEDLPISAATAGIVLITDYPVAAGAQAGIRAAARSLLAARSAGPGADAELVFLTRQPAPAIAATVPLPAEGPGAALPIGHAPAPLLAQFPGWILPLAAGAVIIVLAAGALVLRRLRRRYALSAGDRRVFAELISSQVTLSPGQPR